MRIKVTSQTRALVLPQIIEVSDAEAHRLIMMGCAEPLEAKETPEAEILMETREIPVKEKKTRKGKK